ncbi:hypothetical protein CA51_11440 [Rosistilla oblonga]|nr:hypothetical protein CA51_11440 [Rosistilla oblonga]
MLGTERRTEAPALIEGNLRNAIFVKYNVG